MNAHAADEVPVVEVKSAEITPTPIGLGQIDQVFRDKKKATVNFFAEITVPDRVSVETAPGEACESKVDVVLERLAIVDFSACPDFANVKPGAPVKASPLTVSPPVVAVTPVVVAVVTPERRVAFDVSIGHSSATEMRFDSVDFVNGGTSVSGSDVYTLGTAGQLSLGAMSASERAWGFQGALTLQQKRDVKFEKVSLGGASYTSTGTGATMQFHLLEANALYRWGSTYVPFGLNYSIASVSAPNDTSVSITARGSLGAQVGLGIFVTEHFHLELLAQTISANLTLKTPTTTIDLGNGYLSGLTVKVGYLF